MVYVSCEFIMIFCFNLLFKQEQAKTETMNMAKFPVSEIASCEIIWAIHKVYGIVK